MLLWNQSTVMDFFLLVIKVLFGLNPVHIVTYDGLCDRKRDEKVGGGREREIRRGWGMGVEREKDWRYERWNEGASWVRERQREHVFLYEYSGCLYFQPFCIIQMCFFISKESLLHKECFHLSYSHFGNKRLKNFPSMNKSELQHWRWLKRWKALRLS